MQKGIKRRCRAERKGDRHQRDGRPDGSDLAIVSRPNSRKQQGPGCNRKQDADEWQ
jgi:hypothetical protein